MPDGTLKKNLEKTLKKNIFKKNLEKTLKNARRDLEKHKKGP